MAVIAGRNVGNNDLGVMGGGIVVFVFSLFSWFHIDNVFNVNVTQNGWGSGGLGLLGVLLSIAAAVLIALRVFANVQLPRLQVGWTFVVLAAAGLAALLILLQVLFGYHGWGRSFGIYLSLLASLAQAAFAFLAFRVSGETLPGGRRI